MDDLPELIIKANKFFETLRDNIFTKEEKSTWFKELMTHIGNIVLTLKELQKNGTIKNNEFALIYLRQLLSILAFLIKIFVKEMETGSIYKEARFYVVNQILLCLKGFQEDLLEVHENKDESLLGCFIKLVDYALDKMSEIYDSKYDKDAYIKICSEAKIIVSELMTHAMIIAQISIEENCQMIEGTCLSVLDALEWINTEVDVGSTNQPMIHLAVQACSDKICILERRVNNAVLKLTRKTFSEYNIILDKIHTFCFDFSNIEKPVGELGSFIREHDIQVDRIIQIGLFAVSCSTDKMNSVKIRSCLSILESLESEILPSFVAVPQKKTLQCMNLAILFKEFWLKQVDMLKNFVFRVIDPYAFCQLIYDENKETLYGYYRKLRRSIHATPDEDFPFDSTPIDQILTQTNLLFTLVENCNDHESNNNGFKMAYKNFTNLYNEVKWTYKLVNERKNSASHHRCFKRCNILQTTIAALKQQFLDDNADEEEVSSFISESSFTENSNKSVNGINDNPFLRHLIKRGREIVKDRNNICPTLNESLRTVQRITQKKLMEMKKKKKDVPLSKYMHIRKLSYLNASTASKLSGASTSSNTTNTSDVKSYGKLEFSDIINELNNLTESFINNATSASQS